MTSMNEFDTMIDQMKEQAEIIEANRTERNRKYNDCMNMFKDFLNRQTQMLESTETQNQQNKELISKAFENTFSRILSSSDVTVRKIKQTYNEKKQFWDNVIKMNANIADIELKKEFYLQKRNAQDSYFQAIDHQKDKHKPYHVLMNKTEKKEHLREYQQNNKTFEEKVVQGTNTLQQWQNISNYNKKFTTQPYQQHSSVEGTVINKFMVSSPKNVNYDYNYKKSSYNGLQGENSTLFLNNFTRKL